MVKEMERQTELLLRLDMEQHAPDLQLLLTTDGKVALVDTEMLNFGTPSKISDQEIKSHAVKLIKEKFLDIWDAWKKRGEKPPP
jgi:hypothetical protein